MQHSAAVPLARLLAEKVHAAVSTLDTLTGRFPWNPPWLEAWSGNNDALLCFRAQEYLGGQRPEFGLHHESYACGLRRLVILH